MDPEFQKIIDAFAAKDKARDEEARALGLPDRRTLEIAEYIIAGGTTAPQAREMAQALAQLDWESLIAWREAVREEYVRSLRFSCSECGKSFYQRELTYLNDLPSSQRFRSFCADCVPVIRAKFKRTCILCDILYTAAYMNQPPRFCTTCKNDHHRREWERVRTQQSRARVAGLPESLTLTDWLRTLEHFERKCAYCMAVPFGSMEHFVPLSAGGGTVANNCVPSCNPCNTRKGNRTGSALRLAMGDSTIDRVEEYLRQAFDSALSA
jgi:5-methylcytosine-specific restriction endonuclease McrA